jgi:PAS domain S-box-containing protein
LRGVPSSGYPRGVEGAERELRLYRRLCVFVGAIYLIWWVAVEAMLPTAYNPLLGRLGVIVAIWAIVASSYASAWVRRHVVVLWSCGLWLVTAHYFYLFYENAGEINWVVGSFITVTAVSLGLMSRASLLAYSAFAAALSIGLVLEVPALRHSVFVPGLMTVLLQANIGLNSRLVVLRDLAASNDHFQLLFDSTFEGVLIHERGRIVQVNEALVRILGYTRDELVGREALELVHPDDLVVARNALMAGASSPIELRYVGKDGTAVDIEVRGKPFVQGKRPQRLVTLEDVTERKLRAAELLRTNAALVRSNADLQRFAYIASHDLQTPLRSIASFVDLLRSTYGDTLDPQAKDWLARTSQSVDHLQTLIRDLLEYSRVDVEPRPFEKVSMRDALDRASSLLDAAIRDDHASITSDELPEVTGDHSQLVQLLLNLVGNAIKYHGAEAPRVHVTAQTRGDDWLFEVRDNGIGIAPKHHQHIFEVFKRLHDQKEYPGTGVGLAICRRVIDRHGGKIWVESTLGEGSAFFFTIAKGGHR